MCVFKCVSVLNFLKSVKIAGLCRGTGEALGEIDCFIHMKNIHPDV